MKRDARDEDPDDEGTSGDIEDGGIKIHARSEEVISCTRRSDVPAHMMPWLMAAMRKGSVDVVNPMNRKMVSRVNLSPSVVRCFAYWSKDYGPWIAAWNTSDGRALLGAYDSNLFNFTINGEPSELEPGLETTLAQRLDQLRWLCATFTPKSVVLRFDPIVFYRRIGDRATLDNLGHYREIIEFSASCGIRSVAVAFVNTYAKAVRRMRSRGMEFVDLTEGQKFAKIDEMVAVAKEFGVAVNACSQPEISDHEGVGTSTCIDGNVIDSLLEERKKPALKHPNVRDRGGRYPRCHCVKSAEIGGYGPEFACKHTCTYCYANPAPISKK
jgi:hypothetical protein